MCCDMQAERILENESSTAHESKEDITEEQKQAAEHLDKENEIVNAAREAYRRAEEEATAAKVLFLLP